MCDVSPRDEVRRHLLRSSASRSLVHRSRLEASLRLGSAGQPGVWSLCLVVTGALFVRGGCAGGLVSRLGLPAVELLRWGSGGRRGCQPVKATTSGCGIWCSLSPEVRFCAETALRLLLGAGTAGHPGVWGLCLVASGALSVQVARAFRVAGSDCRRSSFFDGGAVGAAAVGPSRLRQVVAASGALLRLMIVC